MNVGRGLYQCRLLEQFHLNVKQPAYKGSPSPYSQLSHLLCAASGQQAISSYMPVLWMLVVTADERRQSSVRFVL
eukprot:6183787-Pleurochrysis_carterae.AAC.1